VAETEEYHVAAGAPAEPPPLAVNEAFLARIRVVLVESQHPGNVGAAARAMKNMGLRQLVLVKPRRFPDPEASAMASFAADLLDGARIVDRLAEATADCSRVVATTARPRWISAPVSSPRDWAARVAGEGVSGDIALLFGRERTGLTNRELEFAQEIVVIPTADYSSLNLAAAVQVMSYELRMAAGGSVAAAQARQPARQEALEHYYQHLERVLIRTGFLDPANPRFLMRRLRRLYARAEPDDNELNILRGTLTAVEDTLSPRFQSRSSEEAE
jgi:TrmH family RNA methyltransferase